jgi:hypothetical protein
MGVKIAFGVKFLSGIGVNSANGVKIAFGVIFLSEIGVKFLRNWELSIFKDLIM